jgi:hypothetical protein
MTASESALTAALDRWRTDRSQRKLRLTHDGDLHPDERMRLMAELRSLVRSYGEELNGEHVVRFDRWRRWATIEPASK